MKKLFIIVAAALVGMASCSKEGPAPDQNAEGKGTLAIFLNTDEATRANGSAVESKVGSLEIWVFEADGEERDETTPYISIATPDFGEFEAGESEFAPTADGKFVTKLNVEAGNNKQVLVVANAALGENEGATMEEIMALASSKTFVVGDGESVLNNTRSDIIFKDDAAIAAFTGFVMAGQNVDVDIVAETTNTVNVDIYRNVSKILEPTKAATVTVTLDQAEIDKAFGSGDGSDPDYENGDIVYGTPLTFNLTGWAVINGLPKSSAAFGYTASPYDFNPGYVKPSTSGGNPTWTNAWSGWNAGVYTVADWRTERTATNGATELALGERLWSRSEEMVEDHEDYTALDEWTGVYSGKDGGDFILNYVGATPKSVYVYESKPGTLTLNSYTGFNADQVVSMIIQGTLSDGDTTVTRYWRVNVREADAYHIIRNSVYTFEINTIATPGEATPWEAEEEDPIIDYPGITVTEFVISIAPWDVLVVGPGEM